MGKIYLLDCTLRDGAYIVNSKFGEAAIKGIISKSQDAGIDIIECGWLKNNEHERGSSFFHVPDDVSYYLNEKKSSCIYTVMIDWDRYDVSLLPECDGKTIDAIRVVFPVGKFKEGIAVGKKIKKKGYRVFYQAANTLAYSDDKLIELINEINDARPEAISIVDTFGAMFEEELEHIAGIFDENLDKGIKIGFHSHNNQQMSFALTKHFIKMFKDKERDIIADSSLCGMGRGAGNTTTELLVGFLNRKMKCHYDMDAIMDAIDIYMTYFMEKYKWGYSTPYFIAGMYCCHVNNIAYLLNNHRTNSHDMRNIICSLNEEDRVKYDYDLLEEKYLKNNAYMIDDTAEISKLYSVFKDRNILLIAPGKSVIKNFKEIKAFIKDKKPVVIGVNALIEGYDYDYVFFSNSARYEYAKEVHSDKFYSINRILVSSIKTIPEKNESIISFEKSVKRGWKFYDNAVLCCLRFFDRMNIPKISVAGFDGFKSQYNESFADEFLPSLNNGNDWNELNEEIRDMFHDFKNNAHNCKNIVFITSSYYE